MALFLTDKMKIQILFPLEVTYCISALGLVVKELDFHFSKPVGGCKFDSAFHPSEVD